MYRIIITQITEAGHPEAHVTTDNFADAYNAYDGGFEGGCYAQMVGPDGMGMYRDEIKAELRSMPLLTLDDLYLISFS
jgi:hypothetical protein